MTISQAVSRRMRELLDERELSISEFEKRCGYARGSLVAVAYSRNKSVSVRTIFIISNALGISVDEFFNSPLFSNDTLETT